MARDARLGLLLATLLPALLVGGVVAAVGHRDEPGVPGPGPSAKALAWLAESAPAGTPLRPSEARAGEAALGEERLEPVSGGIRPAPPARISVPAVKIDAPVESVGLSGGDLEVPPVGSAGWFDAGPRPGEPGRAVLIGHLDARHGPGLFADVPSLKPGTRITVLDRAGGVHRFSVVGGAEVPKERFPTGDVYGPSKAPVLVLVTCGGRFANGHYRDNVLLYARAV